MKDQQKFQMQLNRLTPDFQARFFDELNAFFNETIFPKEDVPENFYRMRFASLVHVTEQQLSIDTNSFLGLMLNKDTEQYSVGHIIALCNASERTSLIDWIHVYGNSENAAKEYANYRVCMDAMTKCVNLIIEPEKDKLLRKMEALQRVSTNSGRKIALA